MSLTSLPPPMDRSAGILLHPSSFPSRFGIGDLGHSADRFLELLAAAGCTLWQMLPLGPTGFGNSPYQSFGAMAGNPNLVSPELLVEDGLLEPEELDPPRFPSDRVDFSTAVPWKLAILDRAFDRIGSHPSLARQLRDFEEARSTWLDDFALFMALKDAYAGRPWAAWPKPYREYFPGALREARRDLAEPIARHRFRQFLFFRQWQQLRAKAEGLGIRIIGDLPIYAAHDSVDVWANRDLFALTRLGEPRLVAGVPPDYYSATGQLWGNPQYRWRVHRSTGYRWWIQRLRAATELADLVRLDHFRGFHDYWEIPAGAATAEPGRWKKGPGYGFFATVSRSLGRLPLLAEDLGGESAPGVIALRDRLGLPGMKVLQFAFETPHSLHLPHTYRHERWVVYTATHDSDTTVGWWNALPEAQRRFARSYLDADGSEPHWDLVRLAWSSVASLALVPMQDILGLGSQARMNTPGVLEGNWEWRMRNWPNSEMIERLRGLTELFGRNSQIKP